MSAVLAHRTPYPYGSLAGERAGYGEQIELLELDKSGIHVAEYLTTLPPRAVLIERLQQATRRAQLQIEQRTESDDKR